MLTAIVTFNAAVPVHLELFKSVVILLVPQEASKGREVAKLVRNVNVSTCDNIIAILIVKILMNCDRN